MSKFLVFVAASVVAAGTFGQSFECYPNGALPTDPAVSCEGVNSNGLGLAMAPIGTTGVESVASCGFPTNGAKFLRIVGNGPGTLTSPPTGGPFPRPVAAMFTEVRIPIPFGSTNVTMDWEFFSRECPGVPPTNLYYDGMSIDVVTAGGTLIQNLVYADTASPEGPCSLTTDYCAGPMAEVLPAGPNALVASLPALSGCEYISVVVWNGYDNAYASVCYIDNIQFNSSNPACPVPCFIVGAQPAALGFSSPSGPGCLLVSMANMPSGGLYFLPATLSPGNFPNGWLYGVDISFQDLANQINTGYPFVGSITGTACSPGSATIGEFCGLPSGLTIFAVALGIPSGSSFPSVHTLPVSYTIP